MQLCHILNSRSQHGLTEFNFVFLQDFIFNHCIGTNFGLVNVVVPFKIVRKMNPRWFWLISRNVYEPFKVKRNFSFLMRMSRHCFQWVELQCSYHDADHFWSNSKSLFMTALALSSSEKSRISVRFISEGYVYLASIDEIIKIKGPRILPWSHEYQIHNIYFWERPAVLYCSDNWSTNQTKDRGQPFFNLKINREDLEGDRGLWVNYYFFLDFLCWWLFWLFWRPYWLWFRYNNVQKIIIIWCYEINIRKKLHLFTHNWSNWITFQTIICQKMLIWQPFWILVAILVLYLEQ